MLWYFLEWSIVLTPNMAALSRGCKTRIGQKEDVLAGVETRSDERLEFGYNAVTIFTVALLWSQMTSEKWNASCHI